MEDTSGFYKREDGATELMFGPNSVSSAEYDIHRDYKYAYSYPIGGWYWFDTKEEAYSFFNLTLPKEAEGVNE